MEKSLSQVAKPSEKNSEARGRESDKSFGREKEERGGKEERKKKKKLTLVKADSILGLILDE